MERNSLIIYTLGIPSTKRENPNLKRSKSKTSSTFDGRHFSQNAPITAGSKTNGQTPLNEAGVI